jgi:hypothetical protein
VDFLRAARRGAETATAAGRFLGRVRGIQRLVRGFIAVRRARLGLLELQWAVAETQINVEYRRQARIGWGDKAGPSLVMLVESKRLSRAC